MLDHGDVLAAAIEHLEEALKLAANSHVPRSQSNELKADIESKLDAVKQAKAAAVQVAEEAQSHVAAAKKHAAKEDFQAAVASYERALERAREAKSLGESIASEANAEMESLRRCEAQALQRTRKAIADAAQSHVDGRFDGEIPVQRSPPVQFILTFHCYRCARSGNRASRGSAQVSG